MGLRIFSSKVGVVVTFFVVGVCLGLVWVVRALFFAFFVVPVGGKAASAWNMATVLHLASDKGNNRQVGKNVAMMSAEILTWAAEPVMSDEDEEGDECTASGSSSSSTLANNTTSSCSTIGSSNDVLQADTIEVQLTPDDLSLFLQKVASRHAISSQVIEELRTEFDHLQSITQAEHRQTCDELRVRIAEMQQAYRSQDDKEQFLNALLKQLHRQNTELARACSKAKVENARLRKKLNKLQRPKLKVITAPPPSFEATNWSERLGACSPLTNAATGRKEKKRQKNAKQLRKDDEGRSTSWWLLLASAEKKRQGSIPPRLRTRSMSSPIGWMRNLLKTRTSRSLSLSQPKEDAKEKVAFESLQGFSLSEDEVEEDCELPDLTKDPPSRSITPPSNLPDLLFPSDEGGTPIYLQTLAAQSNDIPWPPDDPVSSEDWQRPLFPIPEKESRT
eukprot:g4555.t1